MHHQRDMASAVPHRDRVSRVLQQIREGLTQHPAVAGHHRSAFGNAGYPVDAGPRGLLQNQRFTGDAADILRFDHRLRHAGEGREFIDHAADIADVADDRVGTLREGIGIGLDFLGEATLQPLCR